MSACMSVPSQVARGCEQSTWRVPFQLWHFQTTSQLSLYVVMVTILLHSTILYHTRHYTLPYITILYATVGTLPPHFPGVIPRVPWYCQQPFLWQRFEGVFSHWFSRPERPQVVVGRAGTLTHHHSSQASTTSSILLLPVCEDRGDLYSDVR